MSEFISTSGSIDPFTPVPNYIIHNKILTIETKMTWIYLFSRRNMPKWKVRPFDVQETLGYSNKIWRRVSKQLTEFGFLTAKKTKNGTDLIFTWSWEQIMSQETPKAQLRLVDPTVDNSVNNM